MARHRARRRGRGRPLFFLALVVALLGLAYWAVGERLRERKSARHARPAAPAPRPQASPQRPAPAPAPAGGRIAIVVDDLGRSLAEVERLQRLGAAITYAVLPFEPRTREVAEALRAGGAEVLCHLPLEGRAGADPGPGAIADDLTPREVAELARAAIDAVPGAVGLNNHMGSKVTADGDAMRAVLAVVGERGLFFLDSRTTAESVAYELALEAGVPTAQRAVFLDGELEPAAIRAEFARLLELARERGAAIAIAHPHEITFDALDVLVPEAKAAGYEIVPVSYLLDRDERLHE